MTKVINILLLTAVVFSSCNFSGKEFDPANSEYAVYVKQQEVDKEDGATCYLVVLNKSNPKYMSFLINRAGGKGHYEYVMLAAGQRIKTFTSLEEAIEFGSNPSNFEWCNWLWYNAQPVDSEYVQNANYKWNIGDPLYYSLHFGFLGTVRYEWVTLK